eukprot:scaffold2130_cov106-Skeletonema_dohrnii-CCMP3373.AAC.10
MEEITNPLVQAMLDDLQRRSTAGSTAELVEKITTPHPGNPLVSGLKCEGCGISQEDAEKALLQCARCHQVCYCSRECQKSHWKESHKNICAKVTAADKEEGKRVIEEMKQGDVSSMQTLQRSDAAYDVAKKLGLFDTMEDLFEQDMEGELPNDKGYFSTTQEIITNIFKGNREVHDRYTCACPVRTKEYILSSPTAWDNMMDATLFQAKIMTKADSIWGAELGAWRHSAARDVFATINLALLHEKVAKALFFQSKATGKRSQEEAREYALNVMAPKLKEFCNNGGEGFASSRVDRNETIQNNVHQFTALLSYWYRTLNVDDENPNAFIDAMQLDDAQEFKYETIARPLAEGSIQYGRTLTMDEFTLARARATAEYQRRKGSARKKSGKKKGSKKKK